MEQVLLQMDLIYRGKQLEIAVMQFLPMIKYSLPMVGRDTIVQITITP